jgi:hypothetical protein
VTWPSAQGPAVRTADHKGVSAPMIAVPPLPADASAPEAADWLDELSRATGNPTLIGAARWLRSKKGRHRADYSRFFPDVDEWVERGRTVERASRLVARLARERDPSLRNCTLYSLGTMIARAYRIYKTKMK